MEITIGYQIKKPVRTQAECNAYSTMARAVTDHNQNAGSIEAMWRVKEKTDCYEVAVG